MVYALLSIVFLNTWFFLNLPPGGTLFSCSSNPLYVASFSTFGCSLPLYWGAWDSRPKLLPMVSLVPNATTCGLFLRVVMPMLFLLVSTHSPCSFNSTLLVAALFIYGKSWYRVLFCKVDSILPSVFTIFFWLMAVLNCFWFIMVSRWSGSISPFLSSRLCLLVMW